VVDELREQRRERVGSEAARDRLVDERHELGVEGVDVEVDEEVAIAENLQRIRRRRCRAEVRGAVANAERDDVLFAHERSVAG